ncbi:hypothetical protein ACE1CD_26955 [Aerosakkonema sp. BLCC-F183]|uniref:hypothetical protein n=1 Tax=Aerosakkonema sp. BLCC-F183 TaxID=3342834 RepID=UPI0035BACF7D
MGLFDRLKPKQKTPDDIEDEVIKVADDIQLTVRGIPSDLAPEKRKAIFESLIRNTMSRLPERAYNPGENIYQGKARLRINDEMCDIVYSIDALRVLTALKIYKDAFDHINAGAREGIYDRDLAELTADYIKQSAWEEVESVKGHNQHSTLIVQQVDENTEVAIEGLPTSIITPIIRTEVVSKLVKDNIRAGASSLPSAIIDHPKTTTLKIGGKFYEVDYVFRTKRDPST